MGYVPKMPFKVKCVYGKKPLRHESLGKITTTKGKRKPWWWFIWEIVYSILK